MKELLRYCLLLTLCLACPTSYAAEGKQHILVLHSYDSDYEWTREFQRGIRDAADAATHPLKLSVEYIDSKRLYSQAYYQKLKEYLAIKYQNYHFDGVLLTDDNALRFFKRLDIPNLKNLPTVAAGIGDFEATLSPTTNKGTVLFELDNIQENLALIIRLRPKLKQLYYLADSGVSSELLRTRIMTALKDLPNLKLVEIRDKTLQQTSNILAQISPDDAVLLTHYNTEVSNNIYHGYTKTALELSAASKAPIFVLWNFYLKGDVLGGYVNGSYKQGVQMLDILGRQLPKPVKTPIEVNSDQAPVFQYHALKKYQIDESLLPTNSKVIGRPISFWERNHLLFFIAGSIIFALILVIVLLSYLLKRRQEMSKKDKQIVNLQSQTLQIQKKLIHVLGNSIETRSGETGNHVKRVAKLSAHLGKLIGLSARDCEVLEIISPMHDVGKIGIPEAILNKPGRLSAEERSLMETHTQIGYQLLHNDDGDIIALAAIVALEHHEHWNGNGYPHKKSGEKIHIYSRITAIADVFDALKSQRCYKDAWPLEQVIEYFEQSKGAQFDPNLIDLFLENIDEFVSIRNLYPD
ncbi:HD domain-containing phosphohydrolase [Agarivorans sp. QJM3NY_33]|uniref:HD domain-containing phosphohydrolase n=1 Tax=Agarivorans sp. QJM3NY_33 TaxID=3421432 RepID=UPI003D7D2590